MNRILPVRLALALGLMIAARAVSAVGLPELLAPIMDTHERIVSARAGLDSAINQARVTRGDWFPSLDVTGDFGHEHQRKPGAASSSLFYDDIKLKVTQLIWDFGATDAAVEVANMDVTRAELSLLSARQDLISEAVGAYAELVRARDSLEYAKTSEDNIRRQTGLEEIRIEAGSGLSTDLLQAKTQLAGAQARRVDAEGSLETGINRYRALFGEEPPSLDSLSAVAIDDSRIPPTLTQAIDAALSGNPDLQDILLEASSRHQDLRAAEATAWRPTITGSAEHNMKTDAAGTDGFKTETLWKIEINYPFNLGFTAINEVAAARLDALAADADVVDTRRTTEQEVRDAWQQWQTARQKAVFLADQARIAKAFLDLAIEERQLGQRSLIDVLSGETSWINAKSDAESARTDIVLAASDLLAAIGKLDLPSVITPPESEYSRPGQELEEIINREQTAADAPD